MKRFLIFVLLASPASADEISPQACGVLAKSADEAAQAINNMADRHKSNETMLALEPVLSPEGKAAADRLEKARVAVLNPMRDYADAMTEFAKTMHHCAAL